RRRKGRAGILKEATIMVQVASVREDVAGVDGQENARAFATIAPRPIGLPKASLLGTAARGARVLAVGTRYFAPAIARRLAFRDAHAARQGRRMLEGLGATYMKFGQFVA